MALRSRIAVLSAAIAIGALSAASVLPARWALRLLPDDGLITVADADGTFWHGRAWIALGHPETRRLLPDPVQWQWRGLAIELSHPWLRGPLTLSPGWNSMEISAQQAQLPAAALTSLGMPWNTLAPTGKLELAWHTLSTRQPQAAGPLLDLTWRDAGSALSPLAPLGSYRLHLASTGKALTLDLTTEQGPLALSGQGSWDAGRWRFQGQAKADANATATQAAQLAGLLTAIGPLRNGTHPFEVN